MSLPRKAMLDSADESKNVCGLKIRLNERIQLPFVKFAIISRDFGTFDV
jgi:hypothetical protein